jgi:leukotriene A-4 hydrolase/aminopeptidase
MRLNSIALGLLPVLALTLGSCGGGGQQEQTSTDKDPDLKAIDDPHTYARPGKAAIQHLDLDIKVNFEQEQISGTAAYQIAKAEEADSLYLDTRNLDIQAVTLGEQGQTSTGYQLGKKRKHMGRPLAIALKPETQHVNIQYQTNPGAAALQWLDSNQTKGGDEPYLFTQSQAILARTWIPIQDGPGIRFTYNAEVEVPEDLMALMSAENPKEKREDGIYNFEMEQPIPAYLMAMAVGDITYEAIGEKTGVYTEPEYMEAATYEFGNLDSMMAAAERLFGPYQWEQYDLLVLPPSFPFGGMENPRLSFITPTILAGDRSLTALVAHELAHSWSGNLVTNATWNDFWINEGFTVYSEWRIMEELKGKSYVNMLKKLSYQGLKDHIAEVGADDPMTRLHMDLKGQDPDDALTPIPYDKGAFMLETVERVFGRERFDSFLRLNYDRHAFKTMNSEHFLGFYEQQFGDDTAKMQQVKAREWIHGTGLPATMQEPESQRLQAVSTAIGEWTQGDKKAKDLKTADWTAHEWQYFITNLPRELSMEQLKALDKAYNLTQSDNSEIQADWYELALVNDYKPAYDAVEQFLTRVGRRKFLTPLYSAMMNAGKQDMAKRIYQKARPNYHTIARGTLDKVVEIEA